MRVVPFALSLVLLLGVSGCITYSLHSGYRGPQDFVADDHLAGTWVDASQTHGGLGGPEQVRIVPRGERALRVVHWYGTPGEGDSIVSLGHALRFGSTLVLDLEPDSSYETNAFVLPAHTFWKAELAGDTLRWGGLDPGWAARAAHAVRCPVDSLAPGSDPTLVLTGHTPAVRRLLARAATDPRAFELKPMVRVVAAGR